MGVRLYSYPLTLKVFLQTQLTYFNTSCGCALRESTPNVVNLGYPDLVMCCW